MHIKLYFHFFFYYFSFHSIYDISYDCFATRNNSDHYYFGEARRHHAI